MMMNFFCILSLYVFLCTLPYASPLVITIASPTVDSLQSERFPTVLATFSMTLTTAIVADLYILPADNLACAALNPAQVAGKIVLVNRGACFFQGKCQAVLDAGGVACVISNVGGDPSSILIPSGSAGVTIPIVSMGLSQNTGDQLRNLTNIYGSLSLIIRQDLMRPDQRQALVDLYLATDGPNWAQNVPGTTPHGWPTYNSTDPCSYPWVGVNCNPDGTIDQLLIGLFFLSGPIPASFSTLSTLTLLDLSSNSLTGDLPIFLSSFTNLTQLYLSDNKFTGTISPGWGNLVNLDTLQLGTNTLQGSIPEELYALDKLTDLSLSHSNLSGTISPSLNNMYKLKYLDLSYNSFRGEFPDSPDLASITKLDISHNNFDGEIPHFIANMSTLTTLVLGNNKFIQSPDFVNLTNVLYLDISDNFLEGTVPLPGPQVRFYLASHNNFTTVPTTFTAYPYLLSVDLSYNQLDGDYSVTMGRLPIPTESQLNKGMCLQYIDFSHNLIYCPEGFQFQLSVSRWPLLVSIDFSYNALNTTLQLINGANTYLRDVDVSHNPLSGQIPRGFADLPSLTSVDLSHTFMKFDPTEILPLNIFANPLISTYLPDMHLYCPQIQTQYGAIVEVDYEYHQYELCECEPGFRRRVDNTTGGSRNFECVVCPFGLNCPGRANDSVFYYDENFYPSPNAEDPVALLECRNCESNNGYFSCKPHHKGRLCSQCDDGYFWTGTECDKCIPEGSTLLVCSILLLAFALIGFGIYTMFTRGMCNSCSPMRLVHSQISLSSVRSISSKVGVAEDSLANSTTGMLGTSLSDSSVASNGASYPDEENKLSRTVSTKWVEDQSEKDKKEEKVDDGEFVGDDKSMAAISIAINYYQTVSALSQYFALPRSIISLISASKILSSATGAGVGLACVSPALNDYKNLYVAVMLEPVIVTAVILAFFVIGRLFVFVSNRSERAMKEWDITGLTLILFGLNFLFFPVSSSAINAFRCEEDPATGIRYNAAYPYARCDSISLDRRIVALLFYSGGILVIFSALVVIYNRSRPESKIHQLIKSCFGFFFLHYRKQYNFFAILVLVRRFLLSMLISLIRVDSVLSFGLISGILVIAASLNVWFQPFKSQRDNNMEILTIVAAFFAYTLAFTLSIEMLDYGSVPVVVFYFIVNIAVIVWCGVEFLRQQYPKFIVAIHSFQRKK